MRDLPEIKPAGDCRWDLVSLGEVMLRFDPGEQRIATARSFRVWEGGGEYNVARGLRKCFGLRTSVVTALADNEIGRLIEDLILQGGVDTSHISWAPYDGVGRRVRNGLNFVERGFGVRGALGCSDRANTAVSQLRPGEIDWKTLFIDEGVRWFHCGGIFAGLSGTTAAVADEAMAAAKAAGVVVSYDLNYRPSLWSANGNSSGAVAVNSQIVRHADVLFANEEDLRVALGYEISGVDDTYASLDPDAYEAAMRAVVDDFPNLALLATSLRIVRSATRNDWGGVCYTQGRVLAATLRQDLEILDRIGGGDSFASGLIYGMLTELPVERALEFGVAHGALAMTTPGDTSMATLEEVERLVTGATARVRR